MKKLLYKILDVEPEELKPVLLLLGLSFFMGISVVAFDIGSSTLFLEEYKQDLLPQAFILSGAIGIIASYFFIKLQQKIPFARLVNIVFTAILILITSLGLALEITAEPLLKYISFALLGPINAVSLLCFYGIVSRSFNVRNEKRLTGTVDQGGMFATTIAFFAVFIIPDNIDIRYYIFISAAVFFIGFVFYMIFINSYKTKNLLVVEKNVNRSEASFVKLIGNKYIGLIALVFLFSILAIQFIEFSFLHLSVDLYALVDETGQLIRDAKGDIKIDESRLADFLAGYGTVLALFSALFQLFASDRVIETVGVKVSLLILPVLVGVFTIVTAFLGSVADIKPGQITETAAIFFIFIGLSKIFLQTCIEAFEEPIIKNFFLPIEGNIRHDVQGKVEGVFRQFSFLTAGLLLYVFGVLHFKIELYSFVLLIPLAGYFYACWRLYDAYRGILQKTLSSQKTHSKSDSGEYSIESVLKRELKNTEPESIVKALKLIERIEPALLESATTELIYDHSPAIRKFALQKIDEFKLFKASGAIKNSLKLEESEEIKKLALQALDDFQQAEKAAASDDYLFKHARSKKIEERAYAARLLAYALRESNAQLLIDLLKDSDPVVRKSALLSAGKVDHPQCWPILIDQLSSSAFSGAASTALYSVGEKIVPVLDIAFYKTGQDFKVMVKIIQILGKIGGKQAIEALWSKIDFPDKKIVSEVLLALSQSGYKVEGERARKIFVLIETEIKICAWKIAALLEIDENEQTKETPLRQALIEDIGQNDHNIFLLLTLVYDPSAIRMVRSNIESRTVEGVLYAMELLDVFIADELKPTLFPLLDQLSIHEKIEKLQVHFPRESQDATQVLRSLINKDFNEVNKWTKACAMYKFSLKKDSKIYDDLVANLFNPDRLLRETAAWVIYVIDSNAYHEYTQRIPQKYKSQLDAVVLHNTADISGYEVNLLIEKVLYLKEIAFFENIPGIALAALADHIQDVWLSKGDVLLHEGHHGNSPVYIIAHGTLLEKRKGEVVSVKGKKSVLGYENVLESDIHTLSLEAGEDSLIYKIDKDIFYETLSGYYEMAQGLIPRISHAAVPEIVGSNN